MIDLDMVYDPGSFRDPSGIVFRCGDKVYRKINHCYNEQYKSLMSSGLYNDLIKKKLLIEHNEVDKTDADDSAFLIIEPEIVPLISYPYEWCFGQLKDAALKTLKIHRSERIILK